MNKDKSKLWSLLGRILIVGLFLAGAMLLGVSCSEISPVNPSIAPSPSVSPSPSTGPSPSPSPSPASNAKALTAFGFAAPAVTGVINETAKTIAVSVPIGTDLSHLVAVFSTNGTRVTVGSVEQVSGTTVNNFSAAVNYSVAAADGSTTSYAVSVTYAIPLAKITSFYFTNPNAVGVIDESAHTITVAVPLNTDTTNLVARFSTNGISVIANAAPQISGSTANDYSSSVTYTVTGTNLQTNTYTVSVVRQIGLLAFGTCVRDSSGKKQACYWKYKQKIQEGVPVESFDRVALVDPVAGGNVSSEATCAQLIGNDVYVGGFYRVGGGVSIPGYWKNNTWVELPRAGGADKDAQVLTMAVTGSDIYFAGFCSQSTGQSYDRFYGGIWKNGVWYTTDTELYECKITCASVCNGNVYFGGFYRALYDSSSASFYRVVSPSVIGLQNSFPRPSSVTGSIGFNLNALHVSPASNGNVTIYAGGYAEVMVNRQITHYPGYYKDATWVNLGGSGNTLEGEVTSFVASDSDLYAGGFGGYLSTAYLWKNGISQGFDTYNGSLGGTGSAIRSLLITQGLIVAGGSAFGSSNINNPVMYSWPTKTIGFKVFEKLQSSKDAWLKGVVLQ